MLSESFKSTGEPITKPWEGLSRACNHGYALNPWVETEEARTGLGRPQTDAQAHSVEIPVVRVGEFGKQYSILSPDTERTAASIMVDERHDRMRSTLASRPLETETSVKFDELFQVMAVIDKSR